MRMKKVSIVIVTYNSEKDIFDCVESIKTHADIPLEEIELIVVDNNSREPEPMFQRLRQQWGEEIVCIKNTHNAGYGQGNNVGIRRSTSPLILIMNPDVRLCEPIFKKPLRAFEKDDCLCIYGMKQRVGSGSDSTNSFSCSYMMNGYLYTFLTGLATRFDHYNQNCMYLSGSCFYVRKEMFDAVGLFDESVFMYNEEDDIRYRLLKQFSKARIHYDKDLHYIHLGGDRPVTVDYEKKLLDVAIIQNEKKGYSRQQTILNRLRNKRVLLWRAWLRYKLKGEGKENYETLSDFCAYLKSLL